MPDVPLDEPDDFAHIGPIDHGGVCFALCGRVFETRFVNDEVSLTTYPPCEACFRQVAVVCMPRPTYW